MATVQRKKADPQEKIVINMTELILQNVDRTRADIQKWWTALQNAEQISYPNRSRLYDLYERIRLDGHLSGIRDKRNKSVLNKTMHYEVDGKRKDELNDLINSKKFRDYLRRIMDAEEFGVMGVEFLVGEKFDFVDIPRKHIKPEGKIIALEQNGDSGIDYTQYWNIVVLEGEERFGYLLKCCPYAIWKTGNLADLAQYIELYGQPIRKATYDASDIETKKELKRALKESGSSFTIMMPKQAELEIIGDNRSNGNGEVHKIMFNTCNNEMSVIVLGNTETTSNDNGGSNAKSQVHAKQQGEITKADLMNVADALSSDQFKLILKSYGYPVAPGDKGKFVFEKETDLDELKVKKEIDIAISTKVPVSDDYWYEKYDIPKPDNYDELKKKMEEEKAAQQKMPIANEQKPKDKKPKPKNQLAEDDETEYDTILGKKKLFQRFLSFFD